MNIEIELQRAVLITELECAEVTLSLRSAVVLLGVLTF